MGLECGFWYRGYGMYDTLTCTSTCVPQGLFSNTVGFVGKVASVLYFRDCIV